MQKDADGSCLQRGSFKENANKKDTLILTMTERLLKILVHIRMKEGRLWNVQYKLKASEADGNSSNPFNVFL